MKTKTTQKGRIKQVRRQRNKQKRTSGSETPPVVRIRTNRY
ncbi:hypothetical protein [Thalassotalea profundi]|nr:hypothetical protein [Thalassotalea profundi]